MPLWVGLYVSMPDPPKANLKKAGYNRAIFTAIPHANQQAATTIKMTLYSKIEGHGQPLLILHGFLGMSDNWKTLATHYASDGFQVHALDLRNHGRSFHSEIFNYDAMVQDILDYCHDHQLDTISIIGHSMGGKVAMLFAVQHPNNVNKLIVADIGTKYYPPHHTEILDGLNAIDFSTKPERSDIDGILKNSIPDIGTRQFLMKSLYWQTPGQLAFRFNLAAFNQQIENIGMALPANASFDKPTLFVRGGNSHYVTDEDVAGIRLHFPNAIFETISNVGHWLHAENPTRFYEITSSFLKS